jgi:coenzyme F420-0:L-glutamate ligase/coenzyme F420-1:gamma-L-glutamate ligase
MAELQVRAIPGIPEVRPGDDLAAIVLDALGNRKLGDGAVIAIAHTVVSKAEGAVIALGDVTPSPRALELAAEQGKDARMVQVVLDQCSELLRAERGVLIGRTRQGFVCANGGVDASNAGSAGGPESVIVLPHDPDSSARAIRARIGAQLAGNDGWRRAPGVMITDSFGRAWRHGQVDVAIGLAGFAPLDDWRGRTDADGLELRATWLAIADAAAGAADLARAKDSSEPIVVIEGLERFISHEDGPGAQALLRPTAEDLFG